MQTDYFVIGSEIKGIQFPSFEKPNRSQNNNKLPFRIYHTSEYHFWRFLIGYLGCEWHALFRTTVEKQNGFPFFGLLAN